MALVCLALAFSKGKTGSNIEGTPEPLLSQWHLVFAAIGTAIFILGLAGAAHKRNIYLAATAFIPVVIIMVVPLICRTEGLIEKVARGLRRLGVEGKPVYPFLVLTLVPVTLLVVMSFKSPILASRGFVMLVPYLLAWIAVGLVALGRSRLVWLGVMGGLVVLHVGSLQYFRGVPAVREYREVAERMKMRFAMDDLVFVRSRHWATTPLFYHLEGETHRLVAGSYGEELRRCPKARVWVMMWEGDDPPVGSMEALSQYSFAEEVQSLRCLARLYIPKR